MMTAPEQQEEIEDWARKLLDETRPKAIISIERLGPNENGIVHYSTGVAPDNCVNIAPLFDQASARGILTIGIGDNGNEIGFGRIHPFMQDFHPYGRETQTDKPGGAVTVTATDIFLPASISNWGAYGIAAMLGFLLKDKELVQDPELEKRILRACLDAGGWEMRYCSSRFIVDGAEGGKLDGGRATASRYGAPQYRGAGSGLIAWQDESSEGLNRRKRGAGMPIATAPRTMRWAEPFGRSAIPTTKKTINSGVTT